MDHNERSQAVDGIKEAEILEIIDHHKLSNVETMSPIYFRNQPVGCTATIVYLMYKENALSIGPKIAGLLCSAILSDTLIYQSPTCTPIDRAAAEELAAIAGVDVQEHAREMFAIGSNLRDKSPEEVFYHDFKKFTSEGVVFGVGQISSMDGEELENSKAKLVPYLEKAYGSHAVTMMFFMLTNILENSTEILYYGEGAKELILDAFAGYGAREGQDGWKGATGEREEKVVLKDVVSRKKQLIPALMLSLQKGVDF